MFASIISMVILTFAGTVQAQPFAYVANQGGNNVSVINTATDTLGTNFTVGTGPNGLAVDNIGKRVYVANITSNDVSVFDNMSNTVIATIPVGANPRAVAVNSAGTRVYVSSSNVNSVSVIDTMTNTVIATIPVGLAPRGVAVNAAGTRVYVANASSNNISVIDATNNTVITTVGVGTNPFGVSVNPAGTRVYVTNQNTNDVAVIDATNNSFLTGVIVGSVPRGIAVNPAGTRAYVANTGGNTVSVIDITNNTVVATVPVGSSPVGVAVNPAGTKIYVANGSTNNVSVIDGGSNLVISTLAAGSSPGGIAMGPILSPLAPNLVSVTPGNGFASVVFSPPTNDGGSPITSYTAKSNPANITVTGTSSPLVVTGLTNGTSYTFTVVATNVAGSSLPSAVSSAVIPAGPPAAPTITSVTTGNGQATVLVTLNSSNGSPITGYTVTSNPAGGLDNSAGMLFAGHTITGLTNGVAYTFTVVATNAIGSSPPSAPSSSVTPATVPSAPIIGTATGGNTQASVSFAPPTSNGGAAITSYQVTTNPVTLNTSGTGSPIVVTGLTNGTTYTFTVRAFNSAGASAPSASSNSVVPLSSGLAASQRAVLISLYASTNGASWTNKTNWNGVAGTECTWFGVICNSTQSNVIGIQLRSNNLVGTLPVLSGLTALQSFDVRVNQLTGPVPSLTGLTALQSFAFGTNQLSGVIPDLTGLTNLRFFDAFTNQLTGSIPSLTGFSALRTFSVGGNQLTGTIPSLSGLTNLFELYFWGNQLTGTIPSLSGLTALQFIEVHGNQLTGSLPSLSGLTALKRFYAFGNQLTGPIPSLSGLTALTDFRVHVNNLSGAIPSLSGLTALQFFNARNNLLTGQIPSLSGLTALQDFRVLGNSLSGPIPSLNGLPSLLVFRVESNQLSGPVPTPPATLQAGQSNLCANTLTSSGLPATDIAWDAATGVNWQACQTGAAVTLSPPLVNFDSRTVNTTSPISAVTLTNSGTSGLIISRMAGSGDFGFTSTCPVSGSPIAPGGTCQFNTTFTPLSVAVINGAITITSNARGSPHTIALVGTGTAAAVPGLGVSTDALAFGAQTINSTSAAKSLVITNTGFANLVLSNIAVDAPFSRIATSTSASPVDCGGTVAPSSSCQIAIVYTATVIGEQSGKLTISNNASQTPVTIALSGSGTPVPVPVISIGNALVFGDQIVNTISTVQNLTIRNTGAATLLISAVSLAGINANSFAFSGQSACASIAPQGSCTLFVTFTPTTTGAKTAQINFTSNAQNAALVNATTLGGNGVLAPRPIANLVTTAIGFGNVIVGGATPNQVVTLTNTGGQAMSIQRIDVTGDFVQTNNCGNSLAPLASCTINMTYTPLDSGAVFGELLITSNATSSPDRIQLGGTGCRWFSQSKSRLFLTVCGG